eukprot:XP_003725633.2 PREDICTED: uncharacterized protein LOC100892397 [Strongylocentrotus purpuratus]
MDKVMNTLVLLRGDVASKASSRCKEWVDNGPPAATNNEDASKEPAARAEASPNPDEGVLKFLAMSRLPVPESGIFGGDPLEYTSWKRSYDNLIGQQGIPPQEKFYFLLKYLRGEPKGLVQGYAMLGDDGAYEAAVSNLQERYGDTFIISNAYRDRLDAWPKISTKDSQGLRRLADFLRQCDTASRYVHHLRHLDDERESRKLMAKLPDWLVARWGRTVARYRQDTVAFPPFSIFARFVNDEATIACDPVTSFQMPKGERKLPTARAFGTDARKSNSKPSCSFCKGTHRLEDCSTFKVETLDSRKEFVKEQRLCFGCLKFGHVSKKCKIRSTCSLCKYKHPTVLHDESWRTTKAQPKDSKVQEEMQSSSHASANRFNIKAKTSSILPVWLSHGTAREQRLVYAMLDTQSDTTFILDKTKQDMGIKGKEVNLLLSTMTRADERVKSEKITGLKVKAFNSNKEISLPPTYTRSIMSANREHIPTPDVARSYPHLTEIAEFMMPLQDCEIGLLIGYDCAKALAPRAVILSSDENGPFGMQTDLGWSIIGTVDSNYQGSAEDPIGLSHRILGCEIPTELHGVNKHQKFDAVFSQSITAKEEITPSHILKLMEAGFNADTNERPYSQHDKKFLKVMEDGIHVADNGHYEMPLPFKMEEPLMPNNLFQAKKRLQGLRRKFTKDVVYHEHYTKVMDALIKNEYSEYVPEPMDYKKTVWYIPHHGVQQPNKLRVVFDCSAQYKGESLNEHLMTGPDMTNALAGVLCRFRMEKVAFMCDVKEMFHQFQVNKEHRDYLRFLWWPDGDYQQPVHHYRMKVHLFGAASSPGCANYGLKKTATDHKDKYGEAAANFVHNDFYVDDGLISVPTSAEAVDLIIQTRVLCKEGKLHLHKIVSNSREVMQAVPIEDRAKSVKELNLLHDELPIERALGLQWCIASDSFNFRITFADKPCTRRGVLSTVMSLYDPLGLIAPVTLRGRQIVQELCREGADWDDPLTDEMKMRWGKWRQDVICLQNVSIPRCYKPVEFKEVKSAQLHHFSDASTIGYGNCTYLRLQDVDGSVHTTLVMGKSRVAPIKHVTIPRLELMAAVVSTKISSFLEKELSALEAENYFWTDSNVVMGYVNNNERRFQVFVANRISQIKDRSSSSQWRHVDTKSNPADLASRGATVEQLMESNWLKGPAFLSKRSLPIHEGKSYDVPEDDPEVKKSCVSATSVVTTFDLERLERFSSWYQAKRAVANCGRFKAELRKRCKQRSQSATKPLCVEDLNQAQNDILRLVQEHCFPEEMQRLRDAPISKIPGTNHTRDYKRSMKRASHLYKLDPFVDERGVLRVGGRLRRSEGSFEVIHPAILPQKHHVTELIIRHCHQISHLGRGMTINELRGNGFWIIGCSTAVSKLIGKCVTCKR